MCGNCVGGHCPLWVISGHFAMRELGCRRKRLREWLALGPISDEGWKVIRSRPLTIPASARPRSQSIPPPPRPQEVGVATIPTRNCGQLVVTKSVRRQILELVAVMTQAPLRSTALQLARRILLPHRTNVACLRKRTFAVQKQMSDQIHRWRTVRRTRSRYLTLFTSPLFTPASEKSTSQPP